MTNKKEETHKETMFQERQITLDEVHNQTIKNDNIPELRFPEFTDEWKQYKLKDLAKIQRGASPRPISSPKWYDNKNKKVGWVRIGDVTSSSRYLYETEDYFSEDGVKKSRFLPKGSLIMSICATIGKPIITGIDTCIHDGFVGFSNLNNVNKDFLYYILKNLENRFISLSQTGSQANLNTDLINNTKIKIPTIDEQEKIVNMITNIDEKIDLMEKKQEQYQNMKKYSLQNMFPNNDKTIPKLRFPEFTDDWETVKLKDTCTFSKGKGISKSDITDEGIDCIRYGELYTKYNELIDTTFSKTNIPKEKLILSEKNDIIIPSTGETAIDISQASCIIRDNIAIGGDINILKTKENGIFLSYCLNNHKYDIAKLTQGISVMHLYADQLKHLKIKIPSTKQEQEKIVSFLSVLDQKINYTTNEITCLTEFKKGLLQKMFC